MGNNCCPNKTLHNDIAKPQKNDAKRTFEFTAIGLCFTWKCILSIDGKNVKLSLQNLKTATCPEYEGLISEIGMLSLKSKKNNVVTGILKDNGPFE